MLCHGKGPVTKNTPSPPTVIPDAIVHSVFECINPTDKLWQ